MSSPYDILEPHGEARVIGHGCSGVVILFGGRSVLKGPEVWQNGRCLMRYGDTDEANKSLNREEAVYLRLGSHPHILKFDGRVSVGKGFSLKLERALGSLRGLICVCPAPTGRTRLGMAIQISRGMAYMHSKKVFHCDFTCRNVLVFEDWLLKIGDFGGSKIDDEESLAAEESSYRLPCRGRRWEAVNDMEREIFALGSGIYEIMAWKAPFSEMSSDQIDSKYANEEFPDTDGLLAGEIIRSCWMERFESAANVEEALKKLIDIQRRSLVYELIRGLGD
ncbi:MAG: hypothetical protein M1840_001255 [Geoglossum simile]|nr:MAG: hypothetical protein M1840_001255 [Geoglossum simile]